MKLNKSIPLSGIIMIALTFFLAGGLRAIAGEGKEVTLTGEILDTYCFMMNPEEGQGEGHAKCAKACIKKGIPPGLLVDGKVYVLLGKGHKAANDQVVEFAGKMVTIKGKLVEHSGIRALQVQEIRAAK